MEISQYKKIKAAYEKANKAIIELVDTTNNLDPNSSLFGDILVDLEKVKMLLQMQEDIAGMEKEFNAEFMRVQTNRFIENSARLLDLPDADSKKKGVQLSLAGEPESKDDSLYKKAVEHVIESQKPNASALQRKFKIGYNRAAHLIEMMELNKVVSPPDALGKRAIIIAGNGNM